MRLPDSGQHQDTLSVSLSTLSASPSPVVHMRVSNILEKLKPAFLVCAALCYAMMELKQRREAVGQREWPLRVCLHIHELFKPAWKNRTDHQLGQILQP